MVDVTDGLCTYNYDKMVISILFAKGKATAKGGKDHKLNHVTKRTLKDLYPEKSCDFVFSYLGGRGLPVNELKFVLPLELLKGNDND